MEYAIIKTGSKQYAVKTGDTLKVEKLPANIGDTVQFETLMVFDHALSKFEIGTPYLSRKVEGKILEQGKGKKIIVVKFKPKTRYRRNRGHRQTFSKIQITKIWDI